jgi:hypothetical protein
MLAILLLSLYLLVHWLAKSKEIIWDKGLQFKLIGYRIF